MSILSRITVDPNICNGKPIIRGMRITAHAVLEYLAAGDSIEEILEQYPMLEKEDIQASFEYAAKLLGNGLSISNPKTHP